MKIDTEDVDSIGLSIDELRIELAQAKSKFHLAEFYYQRLQQKEKALMDLYLGYAGSTYPEHGTRRVNNS